MPHCHYCEDVFKVMAAVVIVAAATTVIVLGTVVAIVK